LENDYKKGIINMSIEIPDTNTLKQEMLESYRREGFDEKIVNAMAEVPREEFVPERLKKYAYMEIAMPLGEWDSYISTISQPWVVARMCQLLDLNGEEKVLEVGTGSGYHAAVLSRLSKEVVTVECIPDLLKVQKRDFRDWI
jgi:protein-L-isoaspartate(D-aspartate) O-methyltransferase